MQHDAEHKWINVDLPHPATGKAVRHIGRMTSDSFMSAEHAGRNGMRCDAGEPIVVVSREYRGILYLPRIQVTDLLENPWIGVRVTSVISYRSFGTVHAELLTAWNPPLLLQDAKQAPSCTRSLLEAILLREQG
jgi:hypothetical protein